MIDPKHLQDFIDKAFQTNIIPALKDFIEIPNVSRLYDAEWNSNGLLMKAAEFIRQWVLAQGVVGLTCNIIKDQDKSPVIITQIEGDKSIQKNILFYGHYDKQPPMTGWKEGLGPYTPVIQDGKLYGRGGADDGYSTFCAVLIVKYLQQQKVKLPRIVILTEGDEESSSLHLMQYMDKLKPIIGNVDICFCLDSGACDYQRLWISTSLRGCFIFDLTVKVMEEGVHSGEASGLVASPFRIFRQLLSKLQDQKTGLLIQQLRSPIPPNRYTELCKICDIFGWQPILNTVKLTQSTKTMSLTPLQCLINRNFQPQLSVTGFQGLPPTNKAGNVTVPQVKARVSIRIPPTGHPQKFQQIVKAKLNQNVPYNAKIRIDTVGKMPGWNAKDLAPKTNAFLQDGSKRYFKGKEAMFYHLGGTIPLMGQLQTMFPEAELVVVGVLGPGSNAHGPNQFMDIDYTKRLVCTLTQVVSRWSSQ